MGRITDNDFRYPRSAATTLHIKTINLRLVLVCIAAASVGLPIALISIAKTLLLIGGAAILLFRKNDSGRDAAEQKLRLTPKAVLLVIAAFSVSLLWTTAGEAEALSSLGKYGKLLMIPLVVLLVQNRKEALYALSAFAIAQVFLLLSSWMLFLHLPVPWATSRSAMIFYSAFSSYLDEGIMTALFAAICWHLRGLVPFRFGRFLAIVIAAAALFNVFFVFDGRTGHLVAIALVSLAVMWELPPRARLAILVLPFLLLLLASAISPKVQTRLALVKTEVQAFSLVKGESFATGTSSGIRLHLWHRAVQSINQSPFLGSGVGSWSNEFNRIEKQQSSSPQKVTGFSNPHQEYLQWGVQLGIPGILLLLALMISIFRDTLKMERMAARASQSALTALAVACLFNSSIYDALIGDFFCITLGLLLAFGVHGSANFKQVSVSDSRPA
jgi:O-antigen ligase